MIETLSNLFQNKNTNWLIVITFIAAGIFIALVIKKLLKGIIETLKTKTFFTTIEVILLAIEKPLISGIIILGFYLGFEQIETTISQSNMIDNIFWITTAIWITLFIIKIVNSIILAYLKPFVIRTESKFDDQLLPIIQQLIAFAIWATAIVIVLTHIGYDVTALIAGLGIGGLAFALAAKDYIENIFGGISIFTDKPFTVHDRVRVDGFDGTIEEIGIRRSRIRTTNGTLVTIPNAKFINNSVENVSLEPTRKIVLKLGLTYDTTTTGMKQAIESLKQITIDNHKIVQPDCTAYFETFADSSLIIAFAYYINKEADIAQTQSIINLEIMKRFEDIGLSFAFPTQTIINVKE